MKKKGHLLRNCIIVILILSVIYWTGINLLVSAVLVPSFMEKLDSFDRIVEQSYAEQVQESSLQQNANAMYVIGNSWSKRAAKERVEVLSEDGYRLKGVIFEAGDGAASRSQPGPAIAEAAQSRSQPGPAIAEAARGRSQPGPAIAEAARGRSQPGPVIATAAAATAATAHRWVILLHGYTGSKEMMYPYAYHYVQHGYNALAPDFRCQGESEGDYIGLGATDSKDLLLWINLILARDPEAEIVLHGLSMGASTALILSGMENVPPNVRAVISDCAFTDAYSMFREKIGSWFYLPAFPVVDSASLVIRLRAGYDLKRTSPLEAVTRSHIPTLFIHGREDRMIPVEMCMQLYEAAACPKDTLIVDGAGHAQAATREPGLYFDTVDRFLEEHW